MKIQVITLSGSPYARGQEYGAARCHEIQAWLSAWLESIRQADVSDPEKYLSAMMRDTHFSDAINKYTPDLYQEIQGIATGAHQSTERLMAAQLMDEEWEYRKSSRNFYGVPEKCSSLAIKSDDGPTWIGQNMDLGGWTDGHQVLLHFEPCALQPAALVFTMGGMIGLLGVNACGVAVCVNAMPQLPGARRGLPVAFFVRRILQAQNIAEAVRTVCTIPHATGQHYLIADATRIRSFEASAEGVVEFLSADPSRVLHTNHPLTEQPQYPLSALAHLNTRERLRSLAARLSTGAVDLEAIQAALSSSDDPNHPVCRPLPIKELNAVTNFTTGSMVSRLEHNADTIKTWVSMGPPSIRPYAAFELRAMS